VRLSGGAHRRVKAASRAAVELGDVLREAIPGIGMLRIRGDDLHARRGQQAVDAIHRRDQLLALLRTQ
jgi:hypothetical protein